MKFDIHFTLVRWPTYEIGEGRLLEYGKKEPDSICARRKYRVAETANIVIQGRPGSNQTLHKVMAGDRVLSPLACRRLGSSGLFYRIFGSTESIWI